MKKEAITETLCMLIIMLTPIVTVFLCFEASSKHHAQLDQEWQRQHDIGKWGEPPMCHLKDTDSVMQTGDNSHELVSTQKILETDKWEDWSIHAYNQDVKPEWVGKTPAQVDPKHEITFIRITIPIGAGAGV